MKTAGTIVCLLAAISVQGDVAADESGGEVPVRTEPVLQETARDIKADIWINPDLPAGERPELVWVRAIWGNDEKNLYKNWQKKKEWGGEPNWYFLWPGIARFKGRTIVSFQENNREHAYGDTVHHVIVSEDGEKTWKSVAHYESTATSKEPSGKRGGDCGFLHGYFCLASDGRLCMTGRHGHAKWRATAFSEDGLTWTPLRKHTGGSGELFRPAWCGGVLYGLSREGGAWKSSDGVRFEPVKVVVPEDGRVSGNESASAFTGDRWVGFMRSGQISTGKPPYTHWEINTTNCRGQHSNGGPNVKALPNGEVLFASRTRIPMDDKSQRSVICKYDGRFLTPMIGAKGGGTGGGYPSMAWEDGHLWLAIGVDNDKAERGSPECERGLVAVAKFKWPLKPGAKSLAKVCDEREAAIEKLRGDSRAELVSVKRIGDEAVHSGYPSLVRFRERWFCCFREGDDGTVFGCAPKEAGKIRILSSADGTEWKSAVLLEEKGTDLRTPRISATPDHRLMVQAAGAKSGAGAKGGGGEIRSRVSFSKDGTDWTAFQNARCGSGEKAGEALLSRLTWHEGKAYGFRLGGEGKGDGALVSSRDGVVYEAMDDPGRRKVAGMMNLLASCIGRRESFIRFLPGGELQALGDPDTVYPVQCFTAKAPYEEWSVLNVNVSPHAKTLAPAFLTTPDGRTWAAATKSTRNRSNVALYRFEEGTMIEVLALPSAGGAKVKFDQGWPGMVWHDGHLWVAYHSGHEAKETGKKSAVYLAKIRIPGGERP